MVTQSQTLLKSSPRNSVNPDRVSSDLDLHCFQKRVLNIERVHSLCSQCTYSVEYGHSISRNFPKYYYKVNCTIPGGKTPDIVMLDTIQLC